MGRRTLFFGGKGGVGKTTMAAASAVREGESGKKVLLFTTDPAPSLSDSLEQMVGTAPTKVKGVPNLHAMEIDARQAFEEFKVEYGEPLMDIFDTGTYLEETEISEMLSLELPGIDEVMGLKKLMDFVEHDEWEQYIVDTAPTGHTLRLLELPDLLDSWIKFLARIRLKYHVMVRQFAHKERIEEADRFLMEMKRIVKKVKAMLQDSKQTEFIVVTIPEKMAVQETENLIQALHAMQIPTQHIIVNNIIPSNQCSFCKARRESQEKYIRDLRARFKHHTITEIPLQGEEVRGIDMLKQIARLL